MSDTECSLDRNLRTTHHLVVLTLVAGVPSFKTIIRKRKEQPSTFQKKLTSKFYENILNVCITIQELKRYYSLV